MRKTDSIPHTIRFPIEIYQFIQKKADEEFRTFNSLVVHLMAVGIEKVYGDKSSKPTKEE